MIIKSFSSSIQLHSCSQIHWVSWGSIKQPEAAPLHSPSLGAPIAPWGKKEEVARDRGCAPVEILLWPWAPGWVYSTHGRVREPAKEQQSHGRNCRDVRRHQGQDNSTQSPESTHKEPQGIKNTPNQTHTYVQLPTLFKCFKTRN